MIILHLLLCSPQFSGSYCKGIRRRYRVCNEEQCPDGIKHYRDKRCGELGSSNDVVHAAAGGHNWISVTEGMGYNRAILH